LNRLRAVAYVVFGLAVIFSAGFFAPRGKGFAYVAEPNYVFGESECYGGGDYVSGLSGERYVSSGGYCISSLSGECYISGAEYYVPRELTIRFENVYGHTLNEVSILSSALPTRQLFTPMLAGQMFIGWRLVYADGTKSVNVLREIGIEHFSGQASVRLVMFAIDFSSCSGYFNSLCNVCLGYGQMIVVFASVVGESSYFIGTHEQLVKRGLVAPSSDFFSFVGWHLQGGGDVVNGGSDSVGGNGEYGARRLSGGYVSEFCEQIFVAGSKIVLVANWEYADIVKASDREIWIVVAVAGGFGVTLLWVGHLTLTDQFRKRRRSEYEISC